MYKVVAFESASRNYFFDVVKFFQRIALVANIATTHNDNAYLLRNVPESSLRFLKSFPRDSKRGILEHHHEIKNGCNCSAFSKRAGPD